MSSSVMSENETIDASAELSCLLMSSYEQGQTSNFSANRDSSSLLKPNSGRNALGFVAMEKWLSHSNASTASAKENYRPISSSSVSTKTVSNKQYTSSTRAHDVEPSISSNSKTHSTRARDKIRSHKKFQRFLEQSSSSKNKSSSQPHPHAQKQNDDNIPAIAASKLWHVGQLQQQENIHQAKTPSRSSGGSGSGRRQPLEDITRTVLVQKCSGRQQQANISQTPELDRAIAASKFCTADGSRLLQQEDTSQSEIDRVIAASKFCTAMDSHYSQTNRDLMMQNPKRENFGSGDTNYSRSECHMEYGAESDCIPNSIQAPPGASIKQKGAMRQRSCGSSSGTSSVFAKDIFGEMSNITMDSKLQIARKKKQGVATDSISQSARKQNQEAALVQPVYGNVHESIEDYPTDEDYSHYSDPPIEQYLSSPEIQSQQLKSDDPSSRKSSVSFIDEDSQISDPPIAMYQSSPDSQPLGRQSNLREYRKKTQQAGASRTEEESQYSDPPIEFYQSSPDSSQSSEPHPTILNDRLHSPPKARSGSGKEPRDSYPSSNKFMFSPEKQPLQRRSHLGDYILQPNQTISPNVDSSPKDALKTVHLAKSDLNEGFCLNTCLSELEQHLTLPVTPSPPRRSRSVQVKPVIPSAEITVDARLNSQSQSMPPRAVYDMQVSPAVSCLTIPYERTPQSSAGKAMKKPRFQPHPQKPVNQHGFRPAPTKILQQSCVLLESEHTDHQSCMLIPGRHKLQAKAQPRVQKKVKDLIEQRAARLCNSMVSPRNDDALSPTQQNTLTPSGVARREGETPVYVDYIQVSPLTCLSPMNESFGTGMSSLTAVSVLVSDRRSVPDFPKKALWVDAVPTKQNPTVETKVKEEYKEPLEVQSFTKSCLPSICDREPVSRRGIARLNCFAKSSHYSTMTTVDSEKQRSVIAPSTVTPTSRRAPNVEDCPQFHIPRGRIEI